MEEAAGDTKRMLETIIKRLDDQAVLSEQRHAVQAAFNEQVSQDLHGVRKQLEVTQADVDEARLAVSPSGSAATARSHLTEQHVFGGPGVQPASVLGATSQARLVNEGPPLLPVPPTVQLQQPPPPAARQHHQPLYGEERESFVKPPKHDFPRFDGNLPSLWIDRCLSYFELYRTSQHVWVTTASLYLDGRAALWWQAARQTRRAATWELFTRALREEFGPDEFEVQMHQLL